MRGKEDKKIRNKAKKNEMKEGKEGSKEERMETKAPSVSFSHAFIIFSHTCFILVF